MDDRAIFRAAGQGLSQQLLGFDLFGAAAASQARAYSAQASRPATPDEVRQAIAGQAAALQNAGRDWGIYQSQMAMNVGSGRLRGSSDGEEAIRLAEPEPEPKKPFLARLDEWIAKAERIAREI